ncbi:MAG: AbrB/MazE/SpoVT family DNA-binding domain-containing protein [Verrucomicrobiota bacterium]
MDTVTLSPKYRLVIPKGVRDSLKLMPGQKFQVFALGERIAIVPIKPMKAMRGFLKGTKNNFEREPGRL